jgi:hypothetical protein
VGVGFVMTVARISSVLATWVTILAGIFGGGLALVTYVKEAGKTLDDRKKQTFDLARLYYSEEFLRIRRTILASGNDLAKVGCSPTTAITDANRVDFFSHVEFFDLVQTCVETDLCDRETAADFFTPYANWHWPHLKPHIELTRKSEAGFKLKRPYGHGLEKLAINPGPSPICGSPQR